MFKRQIKIFYALNFVRRALVSVEWRIGALAHDYKRRNVIFNRTCTFISLLRGRARGLDIDRLRSLNSAINDCVHRLRGSRSNEYDERVAALGERAVHTDLRLIDWTPFHSTTPRHRGSTPAPSIPPHE